MHQRSLHCVILESTHPFTHTYILSHMHPAFLFSSHDTHICCEEMCESEQRKRKEGIEDRKLSGTQSPLPITATTQPLHQAFGFSFSPCALSVVFVSMVWAVPTADSARSITGQGRYRVPSAVFNTKP